MMEFTKIEVGQEFTMFSEKRRTFMDGSYLEALENNNGFVMATYLFDMTEIEKVSLQIDLIRVRMIREGNKILFITKYGSSPLIFEASFDPTLYGDQRAMQIALNNHMVTFVGIEGNTKIIQSLRYANFPLKLKQALITAWTSAFEEENYSINYTRWMNSLMQYSTPELWKKGEDVGTFGEVY